MDRSASRAFRSGLTGLTQLSLGSGLLVLLCVASIPIFAFGFDSLVTNWATAEYSHGPLIPLISLYLFLRELKLRPKTEMIGTPLRWPGITVLILGLALAVLGNMAGIADVVTYGLILWVSGLVLTVMGWENGKRHQLPVLHLIFMLPLPQILYWQMSIFLQFLSSEIGVWIIRMASVPVFLDGNIIDLGVYKLQVAEACSGLRYLFPILSFSYLIAILYRGPLWQKTLLFALAAPLTVLMNALRIGLIGILVNAQGIEQAQGFMHAFEGWVIFAACIAVLMTIAFGLQKLSTPSRGFWDIIDIDFAGLAPQLKRIKFVSASPALCLALGLTAMSSIAFLLVPDRQSQSLTRDSFTLFPRELDQWSGEASHFAPDVEQALGASDYVNMTYRSNLSPSPVSFLAAWYHSQTEGSAIHSPEVCLPGAGWEIYSLEQRSLDFATTQYGTFMVNRAIIQKGLEQQLVYYWFEQRGRRLTNDFTAKALVLWDGITISRTDGALVRFTTPIIEGETIEAADARLIDVMNEVLHILPAYIPL